MVQMNYKILHCICQCRIFRVQGNITVKINLTKMKKKSKMIEKMIDVIILYSNKREILTEKIVLLFDMQSKVILMYLPG